MKTILELSNDDARAFFLKKESYCSFELPEYVSFDILLNKLQIELLNRKISDITDNKKKPKNIEGINYSLLNNKDGKYAWRQFQLIHPVLYVLLVQEITKEQNWELIKERFTLFFKNDKIECHSLPVCSENDLSDKHNQIFEWWQKVEQRSLSLSIDYNHLLHLDITDCYGSIYTHSIDWALHTIEKAKERVTNSSKRKGNDKDIGQQIDNFIQNMSYGQTNGIPQGSVLMDFIAEMVLGYGDFMLSDKLKNTNITDYKIIRYRDDYRIFTNNSQDASKIAKELSDVLSKLNFRINPVKTHFTDDVVLGSLKPDKIYWIKNKRKTENIQQWLLQLYILGKDYPNSGVLYKETKEFLNWLKEKDKSEDGLIINDPYILISLLVNLAFNNPRLFALVAASLSYIITKIKCVEEQKELLRKISNKFSQLPNTTFLNIWMQRITLKLDPTIDYQDKLCQKVIDNDVQIWNSDWLNNKIKKIIEETEIIKSDVIEKLDVKFTGDEIERLDKIYILYS